VPAETAAPASNYSLSGNSEAAGQAGARFAWGRAWACLGRRNADRGPLTLKGFGTDNPPHPPLALRARPSRSPRPRTLKGFGTDSTPHPPRASRARRAGRTTLVATAHAHAGRAALGISRQAATSVLAAQGEPTAPERDSHHRKGARRGPELEPARRAQELEPARRAQELEPAGRPGQRSRWGCAQLDREEPGQALAVRQGQLPGRKPERVKARAMGLASAPDRQQETARRS
jgi:hypothetical protein